MPIATITLISSNHHHCHPHHQQQAFAAVVAAGQLVVVRMVDDLWDLVPTWLFLAQCRSSTSQQQRIQ